MLHRTKIFVVSLLLLLLTTSVVLAQENRTPTTIISSIVNAPIVPDGNVTGAFPDFVINLDTSMDPAVSGRTLLAGKQIRITMPADFTVNGAPVAGDPFAPSPFNEYSWAVLLQGWPQAPIFSSFPPGDLMGDIRYTISMSGTHTMIITANQDIDGSLGLPGPGIKQIHALFAHLVNPAPGTYTVEIESETGPNGALEVGMGQFEIKADQQPTVALTSWFNGPGRPNAIYQTVAVGDFVKVPYHLLAWAANGEPLTNAEIRQNGPTSADIVVFDADNNPVDVGDVTVTAPAGEKNLQLIWTGGAETISAPISGVPAAHIVMPLVAGAQVGNYVVEFSLDGGNAIQAFVEVVERSTISPGIRTWHGMSYDPVNDTVYLTGGRNQGCGNCIHYRDLWGYDTATRVWEQLKDIGDTLSLPASEEVGKNAFDSESGKMVILGSILFDGESERPMIYTPATGDLVMGGNTNLPPGRFEPGFVYHPVADRVVLFGGVKDDIADTYADTWLYDTNSDTWEQVATIGTPPSRGRFAMDYDSDANKIIMYGGGAGHVFSGQVLSDTWTFDIATSTWTEIMTDVKPQLREQVTGAYDAQSKQFIVFGLSVDGDYETWAFDNAAQTWTLKFTSTIVADPRAGGGREQTGPMMNHPGEMVYSPLLDRVLTYGGNVNWPQTIAATGDLWGYDFESNTWEKIQPTALAVQLANSSSNSAIGSRLPLVIVLVFAGVLLGAVLVLIRRRGG